jgi:RimJ/RimL family protein N-acetyltransferase
MTAGTVRTARLTLVPASREALLGDIAGPAELGVALGRPVAAGWPPRHWDQGAQRWLLDKLEVTEGREPFWRAWYITLDTEGGLVVGTIGFKGPPGEDGAVEVGYSVATAWWRRGIASEACGGLLAWAARDPRVRRFVAHTLAGDPASAGVLVKNGFAFVRKAADDEAGEVDRYERPA